MKAKPLSSFVPLFIPKAYREIQYGNSMFFVRILVQETSNKKVLEKNIR